MYNLDCPLDDVTLIETIMAMNAELAKTGARSWRMHIPVDLSRDSDILIAETARRFRDCIAERDAALAIVRELKSIKRMKLGDIILESEALEDWDDGDGWISCTELDEIISKGKAINV